MSYKSIFLILLISLSVAAIHAADEFLVYEKERTPQQKEADTALFNAAQISQQLVPSWGAIHAALSNGASVYVQDTRRHTPLAMLIETAKCLKEKTPAVFANRQLDIQNSVQLLINAQSNVDVEVCTGADITSKDTILNIAIQNDFFDIAQALVNAGADVNKRNPLKIVCRRGQFTDKAACIYVDLLASRGLLKPNLEQGLIGNLRNPIHFARMARKDVPSTQKGLITHLIKNGANPVCMCAENCAQYDHKTAKRTLRRRNIALKKQAQALEFPSAESYLKTNKEESKKN